MSALERKEAGNGLPGSGSVYLDNAAATPVAPEVLEAMLPYFSERYGNPSALHRLGAESRKAVDAARRSVAALLGPALPDEIHFTSGGSESDNWALIAGAEALKAKGRHIIATAIEHHAVLDACRLLERLGYEVSRLGVDACGLVSPEELERTIRPDTILVSAMFANNEIGTVEPVAEIGRIARRRGVLFHTDAVQAFGRLAIDVDAMGIDLLSSSAHKVRGPKGIGFLYIRKGLKLGPLILGGSQERGRRAGTENVPAIVGYGRAAELALEGMRGRAEKEASLRDHLVRRVLAEIPDSFLNGHPELRLPGNAHFCFRGVESEALLRLLDGRGVYASAGAACSSGSPEPSHVLLAIGRPRGLAYGALRLTLSAENTRDEIDYAADALKAAAAELRR